jgi:chemosensory pili system protein ChpA (sensor histidine kinase/response regulator)
MNAAMEFDVGPLTWVRSEIDLALERAIQSLDLFSAGNASGSADATQVRFCRTYLHQVQGALTIVGLDGVTQFAEALEGLLEAIETQAQPDSDSSVALARKALEAIGLYLGGVVNGLPNQPLRLLPLYQKIQSERGMPGHSAADLFFPDLSVHPPRHGARSRNLDRAERVLLLKQGRSRFQRGLLSWLRAPQDKNGIREMLGVVRSIEETQESSSARAFWWVAGGLLAALSEGGLAESANIKQLCARIDLQIRRLLEGSGNVAERLMRDALYFVAEATGGNAAVEQIKQAYHLETLIPAAGDSILQSAAQAALGQSREAIAALEEAWNKFCAGSVPALQAFKENAGLLSGLVDKLGHTDYRRLAHAVVVAAGWLAENAARHSESLAMEIATAILLIQNAQANYSHLGEDFTHQVDVIVERIRACVAGHPLPPGSEIPLLDEMSRRAQEKLLVGQVAKEILSNLVQIEQVLDGFFRDAEKRPELAGLEISFRQIGGALAMLRQDGAAAELRDCLDTVRRFAAPDYVPAEGELEQLASRLSMLGFFVEAIPRGVDDFDAFVRQMQTSSRGEAVEGDETSVFVEQEVAQSRRETHALLEAFRKQPEDAGLREEVRHNLETLKSDADLVADTKLGEHADALLSALASGRDVAPHIEQAMAAIKPETVEALPPSQETLQLSQASREEIDAELLAIFIEEAQEVLTAIDGNLGRLKELHDGDALIAIRRSFHTLKGSGRMVGLKDLGEAAWSIEQTLNLWLRFELAIEPALTCLLDEAYSVFADWVLHLETKEGQAPDPQDVMARADALRLEADARQSASPARKELALEETKETAAASAPDGGKPAPSLDMADTDIHGEELMRFDFALFPGGDTVEVSAMPMDGDEALAAGEALPFPDAVDEAASGAKPETDRQAGRQSVGISPALFAIFSEEAREYLYTLRRELPVLESEEAPPTPRAMYRAAHTLAGISATVGLFPINRLGLALEHALQRRDQSGQPGSLQALGMIRQAIGELESMFSALHGQRNIDLPHDLIEELEKLYPPGDHPVLPDEPGIDPALALAFETGDEETPSGSSDTHPFGIDPELETTFEAETEAPDISAIDARPAGIEIVDPGIWVTAPDSAPEQAPIQTPGPQEPPAAAPAAPAPPSAHDEIDAQLLPIFLEEAIELGQAIAGQLRAWRNDPDDAGTVHVLARQLHTLKGSARMAGAMTLGDITHALETRVDEASHAGAVAAEVIDGIENAFESIRQIIERLQRGETLEPAAAPEMPPAALQVETPAPETPVAAPESKPEGVAIERRRFTRPVVPDAEVESDAAQAQATLRVRAGVIDRLVNDAGELSIARSRIEGEMRGLKEFLLDLTENVIRLRRQLREIEMQAELQMQSRTAAMADEKHAGFDPLEFDRFTRFQELTRMMAESVNDVTTVQQQLLKGLDDANAAIVAQARLNREVQQQLLSMRMMPFNSLTDRLYRVVRQASKDLDKRANMEIKGGQVELDRGVLDKIAAPLEHMLRNSIAHGIEAREERLARSKPEIGEIALSVKQEGNEIVLVLADDGAGLNFGRIRERAVATGLIGANEEVSEARLAEFIFAQGLSTASGLSQVAGRGVGMDVVKTEITRLGGRVEIESTTGRGTEFRLILPLTLVVTKALLIRSGNKTFAIPSAMIEQVLDLKEAEIAPFREAGVAEWQSCRYPLSYLPHLLGDPAALPERRKKYCVLLLRSGARRIALQVDELLGNQEIVVKNIGPQLARVVGVDGATVLGDGRVVLILNPVALSTHAPVAGAIHPGAPEPVPAAQPTVMVVDDSLTVRKITSRLMTKEGYRVLLARDGVEALEQLADIMPDVVLTDIEMPRMDGFDLARNIRSDERLKHLPIIAITSRTAEKHHDHATEIGIDHYLGKPYQEEELLRLVAGYTTGRKSR